MTDRIDIEQLRADMEAGTQGPWGSHENHRFETVFGVFAKGGRSICSTGGYMSGKETDHAENKANARRIIRLPDLEQAYLDLHAENLKLREAYDALNDISESGGVRHSTEEQDLRLRKARAALAEGKTE